MALGVSHSKFSFTPRDGAGPSHNLSNPHPLDPPPRFATQCGCFGHGKGRHGNITENGSANQSSLPPYEEEYTCATGTKQRDWSEYGTDFDFVIARKHRCHVGNREVGNGEESLTASEGVHGGLWAWRSCPLRAAPHGRPWSMVYCIGPFRTKGEGGPVWSGAELSSEN